MSESKPEKSKEETQAGFQQAEAAQQLSELLGTSGGAPNAPKNLGQGLSSGVSNIVGGAVGAVGIAVLAPTAGLAMGASQGGLLGGRLTYVCFIVQRMCKGWDLSYLLLVFIICQRSVIILVLQGIVGLTGGAVVGALGAVVAVVGGAIGGVSQVVRGVAAIPASISEPRKGNWWDENEGKWVETDLVAEKAKLEGIPEDDKDVRQKSQIAFFASSLSCTFHSLNSSRLAITIIDTRRPRSRSGIRCRFHCNW